MKPQDFAPSHKYEKQAERLPVIARRENVLDGAGQVEQSVKRALGLSEEVINYAAKPENLAAAYPELDRALTDAYNDAVVTPASNNHVSTSQEVTSYADNQQDLDIGQAQNAVERALSGEDIHDQETI